MQEKLLHFVWQYQYFSSSRLLTGSGKRILVTHPGTYNLHAGPDFLFARLRIDGMEWRGHVEIHVRSSDWERHNHHLDPAYDAVILHVVWEHDSEVRRHEGSVLPVLILQHAISLSVFRKFNDLTQSLWHLPCHHHASSVPGPVFHEAMKRAMRRRMDENINRIRNMWLACGNHWEETALRLLIRYAGSGRNRAAFSRLAGLIPWTVLKRHADRPLHIEAMFFGVAGFLQGTARDSYHERLQREFIFLRKKYQLTVMEEHEWKFLRMRPAAFPTRRLAGLATLFCIRQTFFRDWVEMHEPEQWHLWFSLTLPEYWQKHHMFGRAAAMSPNAFGASQIQTFMLNVVIPLQSAYYSFQHAGDHTGLNVNHLYQSLPAENNKYIRLWKKAGITARTAWDTQALLSLYRYRCQKRKCLECPVGIDILSSS